MLVVITITLLTLYFTQQTEEATYQRNLQNEFRGRLGYLIDAQDARQAVVSEQCRQLARSVRIRAALEEEDIDDLYANGRIELRAVLGTDIDPSAKTSPSLPHATFFRFLNANGDLLPPSESNTQPWEKQLAAAGIGSGTEQLGYVVVETKPGHSEINEVITTPILDPNGEMLGALVLGFPPIDFARASDATIKTGIWLNGHVHMPSLTASESTALSEALTKTVQTQIPTQTDNNFTVSIDHEPYLLFYKILNPGSRFPPAYEICLYSLSESLTYQHRLRWQIVGMASLVLVIGMTGSHFFSARLSKPVEELAETSAKHQARSEEAEAARELTEQKYRSIFENAVEGIFLLAPDGRYLSANPAMARIFGYDSPAQLIEETAAAAQKLYLEPKRGEDFLSQARAYGIVSNFECEMHRRNGQTIWVSQNARAVRDASGALLHLEGTLEDITEHKRAADALRLLNEELKKALTNLKSTQNQVIQQERLRALGQMASGIAHDFNNSLMPVIGFSELMLVSPGILDDKKKAVGYLENIHTAAKDAASIVARLREFSRANEHRDVFTPVSLPRLVRQVISLTQPKWKGQALSHGAEIQIIEEIDEVPEIAGDESALREVLTNLIFNAVDAMPRGGTLTFRTRKKNEGVVVEVADTGSGMSEKVRERCLEPFFTTKGDHGTGLGLSMVFGIMQRHKGTLDIETQPGKGTTFILALPLQPASFATTAPIAISSQKLRVLLVDDEPPVCVVLAAFLEAEGHQVSVAHLGIDGLRRFQEEKFDLVITDHVMPGMSGEQMAVKIKAISPTVPIIMVSGFHSITEKGKISGIDVVMNKPITLPGLREAIGKALISA